MRNYWNFQLSKILFTLLCPLLAAGQNPGIDTPLRTAGGAPYLFPINPGETNQLAGTMGELRSTHFHGGIDIRTGNRIGLPVRATHDGYIARVSVSPTGYGNAIYIKHPDGLTSVYGHLERYSKKLARMVRAEQYQRKSFELDMEFDPSVFPVKRGDTVAFSGNTGSSAGPHLHFEIRDGQFALNPLKFGFKEIVDNIPPSPKKIALRTLDEHSRINDRFGRFEFTLLKKSANSYSLPYPILAHGTIGIELLGDDRMNNSPGRCGINYIEMDVDSERVFSQYIDRVNLEETRGILTVLDFKTMETRGRRFNKLYIDDGNRQEFYRDSQPGFVSVTNKDRHIKIVLKDAFGNESNTRLSLKHMPVNNQMLLPSVMRTSIESDVFENTLVVTSRACDASDQLTAYSQGKPVTVNYAYKGGNQFVYLIDLRTLLPDSVVTCSGSEKFHFRDAVPSDREYTYYSDRADVFFPKQSLYDTLFLNVNHEVVGNTERFILGHRTIPLHLPVRITLKPVLDYQNDKRLGVYRREGGSLAFLGGEWSAGRVTVNSRELGEFTLLRDTIPPTVTKIRIDRFGARFRIRDGMSGVSYYEATIDGTWLMMKYDLKTGTIQSELPDNRNILKGEFELKVVDRAGNERIFRQKIQ